MKTASLGSSISVQEPRVVLGIVAPVADMPPDLDQLDEARGEIGPERHRLLQGGHRRVEIEELLIGRREVGQGAVMAGIDGERQPIELRSIGNVTAPVKHHGIVVDHVGSRRQQFVGAPAGCSGFVVSMQRKQRGSERRKCFREIGIDRQSRPEGFDRVFGSAQSHEGAAVIVTVDGRGRVERHRLMVQGRGLVEAAETFDDDAQIAAEVGAIREETECGPVDRHRCFDFFGCFERREEIEMSIGVVGLKLDGAPARHCGLGSGVSRQQRQAEVRPACGVIRRAVEDAAIEILGLAGPMAPMRRHGLLEERLLLFHHHPRGAGDRLRCRIPLRLVHSTASLPRVSRRRNATGALLA